MPNVPGTSRRGAHQRLLCRSHVCAARKLNDGGIPAEQRFDVGEVLPDRDLVALSFVLLVPLIVIVKDQRDDVEEVLDELIWCRRID